LIRGGARAIAGRAGQGVGELRGGPKIDLRPLGNDDIDAAGALLGRAFQDNPAYRALLAHMTDAARAAAVARVKRGLTAAAVRHETAEALWVGGRMACVALTCTPEQYPHSLAAFAGQARGCMTTGWRGIRNFLRIDSYFAQHHPHEPHFYLFVLGVEPELQGTGLGSACLRILSERADAHGLPCYLETDRATSVALYRRAGYVVLTEDDVAGLGGLHMWTMQRPAPSSSRPGAPRPRPPA
jgi:ribosomal protein S18 acetylase RimI-like enzyme